MDAEKRVSCYLKRPNPLFERWLKQLCQRAKGTPAEAKYQIALSSLLKYPLVLKTGKECAILKGFGKNLCNIIDRKLARHNQRVPSIDPITRSSSPKKLVVDELPNLPDVYVGSVINSEKDQVDDPVQDESDAESSIFIPGSFDVILLADIREITGLSKKDDPTIKALNQYHMIQYELRALKVGDFMWIARHRASGDEFVLPHIVERKRIDDLEKSIKDGRFHEQKFRLKNSGLSNIIYLIENHTKDIRHMGLPFSTLMQAIANTRIQDGFGIHLTTSLDNSIRFLAMMTKNLTEFYNNKILRKSTKFSSSFDSCGSFYNLMAYEAFDSQSSKSKNLSVSDMFIKQLLQLKGVSIQKALAIVGKYQTPRNLMSAYEGMDKNDGEQLLSHISNNGDSCNVGPNISKLLYKYFTSETLH